MILTHDDHLGKDHGMSGKNAKVSRPIFGCRNARSINDERIILNDISCCGFKVLHIRPMAKLCLGIAANNLVRYCLLVPLFLLSFSAHDFEALEEHGGMDGVGQLMDYSNQIA